MIQRSSLLMVVLLMTVLTACNSNNEDDLRQWIADERNQTRPRVTPIPSPKKFIPEIYNSGSALDPFNISKLTQAMKRESVQAITNGALVAPELARRKEPLELFPLESMSMVGNLIKAGQPVALVKVDNLLYQVKLGFYLGQNYGKVTQITETQVTLREIVQDSVGEWIERTATLELQERAK